MKTLPVLLVDGYKISHKEQYPDGTSLVYSNWTPRSSRVEGVNEVVFFGLQYFIKEYLQRQFNENFFNLPLSEVMARYDNRMKKYLGPSAPDIEHIAQLHSLGYLPLRIKAVQEGTLVPLKVPMLTIHNTNPKFFWLTNMLETIMSNVLWLPCTSATTALRYRRVFNKFANDTVGNTNFVPFQGHDFSMRGMPGLEAAMLSGAGHLLSFLGTDTVPAIDLLEEYYNAKNDTLIGVSVPATEHSVMSAGGKESEIETFDRLITKIYPNGIISVVSDTWDFWQVITEFMPKLKDKVLAREGKLVIRPDSSDPVKIIVGDNNAPINSPEYKGAIECLWEVFGGTITEKGYKLLDSHIGLIYGDSITTERQLAILQGLKDKGFASDNVVLGIGSYTYQYVTRDTYGFAMKATYCEVNGKGREIFKEPKTDNGGKHSARGLLRLDYLDNKLILKDRCSKEEENGGELATVFLNGRILKETSLSEIRHRLEEVI